MLSVAPGQPSFGGGYCKMKVDNDTGSAGVGAETVSVLGAAAKKLAARQGAAAVKDAVATMVAAIPVITIKDEEDEFDARVGNEEYKKIHKRSRIHNSYYQCTQRITYILSSAYQKRIRVR
jgi:hypothetical protein